MNNTKDTKNDDHALKERILFAAIDEFGRRGYAGASTNAIVSAAGVSKGLLFHYYGTKKDLFMECAQYVIEKMGSAVFGRLDLANDDMFERIKQSLKVKLQVCSDHPELMRMVYKLWYSDDKPIIEEYMRRHMGVDSMDNLSEYRMSVLFKGVDLSKLKESMDARRVMQYIELLLDTTWTRFAAKYDYDAYKIGENMKEYLTEADFILDMIKGGVYKTRTTEKRIDRRLL
ncbi:MAG: TetR/AcrR family transcriptional regulator [Defluviitaleaceae bacterium]|nr:TetR/AcrR family transcriptional regulator [Defluviitaleaceae bacterium]